MRANETVTDLFESTFKVQELATLPEQSPPQPIKNELNAADGVKVTNVPEEKFQEQTDAQFIPGGELMTDPEPEPEREIVTRNSSEGGGGGFGIPGAPPPPGEGREEGELSPPDEQERIRRKRGNPDIQGRYFRMNLNVIRLF